MIHSITILASNHLELSRQSEILIELGLTPFEPAWTFGQALAQVWIWDRGTPAPRRTEFNDD